MRKQKIQELKNIENYNRSMDFGFSGNKKKMIVVKLCIISDILLDIKEFEYLLNMDVRYSEIPAVIQQQTDEQCFAVLIKETQRFVFNNKELSKSTFLQDCITVAEKMLKYVTMQQKIDYSVLLNYIRFLLLDIPMNEDYAKRSRMYIDSIRKSNHTYNLVGKDISGLNRTIDRSLGEIIKTELKAYEYKL